MHPERIFLLLAGTLVLAACVAHDAYERGREAGRVEGAEESRRVALAALRCVTEEAEARAVASGAWRVVRLLLGPGFRT